MGVRVGEWVWMNGCRCRSMGVGVVDQWVYV